jgi:hypothetical protein
MNRFLSVLSTLLLICTAVAAPAPEPFVSGWGNPVDPDKDCKIRRDRGFLAIEMPGNVHDYDPRRKRLNAPRLMRDFEGDFEMQVRVRIDCRPSAQSEVKGQPSYVSAGFLVIPPDTFAVNCIRLEYRLAGQGVGTDGCTADLHWSGGGGQGICVRDKHFQDWPFKGKPDHVYQRLERQGEILLYKISSDGKSWVTMGGGQFIGLPSRLKVGLAAFSTSTELSKVRFDQLNLARAKKGKKE